MRALSIRQPFAELILRGIKTVEYRSRPTRIIGERFFIYATKRELSVDRCQLPVKGGIWSRDLAVPGHTPDERPLPPWMIELAEGLRMWKPGELPTGVIVGSAIVERCAGPIVPSSLSPGPYYQWHLTGVERLAQLRKPKRHPQPAWFNPF
jgi:hypothetical protein